MTSRRATQLCIQRLMTTPTNSTSALPSLWYGIGPSNAFALQLPSFISPMTATHATSPTCLNCGVRMSWKEWYQDAHVLNIGPGKFYARCALCKANDVSFKDGPPTG